ncbi:replication fork protection component Swi3-domain-containing protein [Scheffersomyces xylosifermentans]|uniref:replication fork protection component Swi3-domain-containing protein n=1 Tax=Scheffersomyces xylosifermentans TaxID=1304137 RepID=UPI00315CFBB9
MSDAALFAEDYDELNNADSTSPVENEQNANGNNPNDEVLGEIKLTKRLKIAKIDNDRIFNKQYGLNYIVKNHSKLIRTLKRNDKMFQKKAADTNRKPSSSAKNEHEYNNLSAVLQFYQLWCHGLFPKANFKDCIHLVRALGSKSPQLRIYRRELIEREIYKLKVKQGLEESNNEPMAESSEIHIDVENSIAGNRTTNQTDEPNSNDDFMNSEPSNGLFVGDDDEDDLYHTPSTSMIQNNTAVSGKIDTTLTTTGTVSVLPDGNNTADISDDAFSDDDEAFLSVVSKSNVEEEPTMEELEEFENARDEEDMELLREFGV